MPYLRTADGVVELRATGMPLGLMPGMVYEERSTVLRPGERLLLHSDGLAEAHDPQREMFGFPRVAELAGRDADGQGMIDLCLSELDRFSGPNHEQEDDITLVVLECTQQGALAAAPTRPRPTRATAVRPSCRGAARRVRGPERAGQRAPRLQACRRAWWPTSGLSPDQIERLKTAVAEATMNAIEHGNENRATCPSRCGCCARPTASS